MQFPTYALDATWPGQMNEGVFAMFDRLGVKGMRLETPFNKPGSAAEKKATDLLHQNLEWARKYDVAVMLTLEGGSGEIQPLGEPRPWLDDGNRMLKTKSDMAWLPEYDGAFQQWVHGMAKDYGWPRGQRERDGVVERAVGEYVDLRLGRGYSAIPGDLHAHGRGNRSSPLGQWIKGADWWHVFFRERPATSCSPTAPKVFEVDGLHQHPLPAAWGRSGACARMDAPQERVRPPCGCGTPRAGSRTPRIALPV